MNITVEPIANIYNDYKDKFGIPRQSGLVKESLSTIVFNEKFRDDNSLRGLSDYSHIWLLWIFSEADCKKEWSVTVRPPRLGGNKRMGVFATRSPFHPNKIGLSCVKIETIEKTAENGTVITVSGADLMNGTPIIDIKPYLSFTDCHPDAKCGFADEVFDNNLNVSFAIDTSFVDNRTLAALKDILSQDPRPSYQEDPKRIYTMDYGEYKIKFKVANGNLTVTEIIKE